MTDGSSLPPQPAAAPTIDQEMAAALDAALDALQHGRPIDRQALVTRYPELASALTALDQLFATPHAPAPPPDHSGPVLLPERIGPYRVERQLGAGGFGVVFLGFDPDVKRHVAIKVLHEGRLDQPAAIDRFHREACAIARLRHPGIVQLFDYSREGPPYYLVTEYVEGVDPYQWCQNRQAGILERVSLLGRICDAVEYAHRQGVCHRDLKPGNILVDPQGEPHILDFGLARLDPGFDLTLSFPTGSNNILGSLPYMAPEQAAGHSHTADARSDVYSLGVILYELLTGHLPFEGPAHSLPARVVEDAPPPPRSRNPDIPVDLEAVCLKALAKKPGQRYASAAALARDLRAFCEGRPVTARRPGVWREVRRVLERRHHETLREGWTLLLLLLGTVIFAGCVTANYWEIHLPPGQALFPLLLTKFVQVALMMALAIRLRPQHDPGAQNEEDQRLWAPMSAAEQQIWYLVPAYYGAFLTLVVINCFLPQPLPLAPILAILSGMGFASFGTTIWGWFYVWAGAFFVLAVLIALCAPHGLTLLGLGWFVCLVVGSVHLRWTR